MPDFFETILPGVSEESLGAKRSSNTNPLDKILTVFGLQQIRGINAKGSLGAGIPKHVTNVAVSLSGASGGATTKAVVTFHRDPSDRNYSSCQIWVKGYQGNSNPVKFAQSAESPATFTINNTGEPISVIAQAVGNSGEAPLNSAPTAGAALPKSTAGGYSTSSVTTGEVVHTTVSQVGPRPSFGNWHGWTAHGETNASAVAYGCSPTTNAATIVDATATAPAALQYKTLASPSQTNVQSNGNLGAHYQQITLGILKSYQTRLQLNQTTTSRAWIGIGAIVGGGATLAADNPLTNVNSQNLCMFRYSTNVPDTNWQAFVGTTGTSFTLVDTGVAADTSSHLFEIQFDGTNVLFFIDNVQVAKISTNVPATSVLMQDMNYLDNVSTSNQISFTCSYQYWETLP